MERTNIDYSTKNIPVLSKDEYGMQWKALKYICKWNDSAKETYGFKSRKCPFVIKELVNYEEDLKLLIRNITTGLLKTNLQIN